MPQPTKRPLGSHYAFLRFGLGETNRTALWMAAFLRAKGVAPPTATEQAYIRDHWHEEPSDAS